MSSRFDLLTQALFQKNISECSVEQLQDLADEYPYFAPAQFALTKKLAEEMSPAYEAQVQKAVLYYHEPLYFDHFFNHDKYYEAHEDIEIAVEETIEIAVEETVEIPVEVNAVEDHHEIVQAPEEAIPETVEIKEEAQQVELESITPEIEIVEAAPEEEIHHEETVAATLPPVVDVTPEPVVFTASPFAKPPVETATDTERVLAPDIKEPVQAANNKEETLPFEPYHTIDYFASQGIRLSQEEATKDSLGKQLKSFTEWLKTMKRLPVQEQVKHVDPVSEQKVEHLAAHSVEGGDVLTETMAEVWIKQGNHQKAIDTYHKLSLLNPSKRAYFAAKIDSITRGN